MDATDAEILAALTENARVSLRALGAEVGLSANAVAARVRRLESAGVIAGYTVVPGDTLEGRRGLEVYIDIRLQPAAASEDFMAAVGAMREIVGAAHITGPFDLMVHAVVADTAALDHLLRRLKSECGVAQSHTRVVLARNP